MDDDASGPPPPSPLTTTARPRPDGSKPPRLLQMPALDGIRGIALTTVVWHHFGVVLGRNKGAPSWLHHTTHELALDVFFVLSGALITSLLLVENGRTGTISMRAFYQRRLRRIAPALLLTVAISLVIWSAGFPQAFGPQPWITLVAVLAWVGNWVMVANPTNGLGYLSATWSLAVEEQFYLTWPLFLRGLLRRHITTRQLLLILTGVAVFCYVYAAVCLQFMSVQATYYNSPTVGIGLPIGCAIAVLVVREPDSAIVQLFRRTSVAVVGLAGLVAIAVLLPGHKLVLDYGARIVFDFCTAALIGHIFVRAAEPSWLMRGLSWKPFVGLGVVSYGIYLFHLPVLYAVRSLAKASSVEFQMVFDSLFLVVAATLSYHLLEKPIRRYGVRGAIQHLLGPPRPVQAPTRAVVPEQGNERPETTSSTTEPAD